LNFDEVDKFLKIISEPKGYAFSERRITLSTAGFLDELFYFHELHPRVELAISLNASDDRTRRKLMPNSRLASFSEIIEAIGEFDCYITLEYVLLSGINDSEKDAMRLSGKLKKIPNVMVNLIPFNKTSGDYDSPKWDSVHAFQNILKASDIQCFIRKSRGSEIMAACGQLATGKSRVKIE
ncbi:MAG: 23S rRNA (adenine(2503)-C(2))-methyltransferase RlmN, partial [bacterium]